MPKTISSWEVSSWGTAVAMIPLYFKICTYHIHPSPPNIKTAQHIPLKFATQSPTVSLPETVWSWETVLIDSFLNCRVSSHHWFTEDRSKKRCLFNYSQVLSHMWTCDDHNSPMVDFWERLQFRLIGHGSKSVWHTPSKTKKHGYPNDGGLEKVYLYTSFWKRQFVGIKLLGFWGVFYQTSRFLILGLSEGWLLLNEFTSNPRFSAANVANQTVKHVGILHFLPKHFTKRIMKD